MEKLARKRTGKVKRPTADVDGHADGHAAGREHGLHAANRTNHCNDRQAQMTGQQQYEAAEQLAREADRKGGPLPVTLLQQAAEAGYPPAIHALANWHIHGKGVPRNLRKAVILLKKAAAKRHPPAEYDLGFAYETGKGGLVKNARAALTWYRRAALDGDLMGQSEVARCYYYGIGAKRDLAKAVKWYAAAAERGDAESQYALARAYELGEGIKSNRQLAIRWYQKAAAQGEASARCALAELQEPSSTIGRIRK